MVVCVSGGEVKAGGAHPEREEDPAGHHLPLPSQLRVCFQSQCIHNSCVCECVCVCECEFLCKCACMRARVRPRDRVRMDAWTHGRMEAWLYACMHARTHACMRAPFVPMHACVPLRGGMRACARNS